MLPYVVVVAVAAAITYGATFVVRRFATELGAVVEPGGEEDP